MHNTILLAIIICVLGTAAWSQSDSLSDTVKTSYFKTAMVVLFTFGLMGFYQRLAKRMRDK
ncbi:hypothetical protein BEP19_09370 [Ammoniphilus oxalaticus]|uniref:Uncharacterized protein n=1 Tax=Ammoniphilus oxalaticus TaxID=66863 RepID=A0A419SKW7_9BACL|nr:hypothetical protein [Ammoniphilus oxalaticus]RKD24576.1 hypothetical protein BEP19_09370 [Ammoniphilus oxalaticus]